MPSIPTLFNMSSVAQPMPKGIFYAVDDLRLEVNVWRLLFYLNLFVYGFYGALISTDLPVFLIMMVVVIITQLSFGLLENRQLPGSVMHIAANSKIVILFLLVLTGMSYSIMNNSLLGDELSYTQSALRHSLVLAGIAANKAHFLDSIQFKYLVLVINFIILVIILAIVYLLNAVSSFKRIALSVLLMIAFRSVIFKFGGNASPHPPLNHIFTFITGAVLPLSNFTVRFSYLLAFTFFAVAIYYLIRERWPGITGFLITCAVISIPPLLHLGVTVETSLWTTCIFSYILVYLVLKEDIDYGLLIVLGSIFTVARIPSVIILVPVFLFYLRKFRCQLFSNIIDHMWRWAPVILFLPFLIPSVIKGTAATDYSTADTHIIDKYATVLKSNAIWHFLVAVFPVFWIIFLLFAFLKKNKGYLHVVVYLLTFLILLAVFYSLKPHLWGGEKYQDEVFIPFIIVGFIKFLMLIDLAGMKKIIISASMVIIIALNLFYLGRDRGVIVNSNINKYYPYTEAYAYINHINAQDSTLSVGLTYGVLPEIINGYTSLHYKRALAIYKNSEQGLFSSNSDDSYEGYATKINADKKINYLIIGLTADKDIFSSKMKSKNWIVAKNLQGGDPSFDVLVLRRQL